MAALDIRPKPSIEEAEALQGFWEANRERFLAEYPESFVAVKDGVVIAAHKDLAGLLDRLNTLGLDPRDDVAIEFVTEKGASWLL